MFNLSKSYYPYLLSCVCAFSSTALAQDTAYLAPLAEQSVLLDLNVSDYSVVVGERGHVLVAQDKLNFSQVSVPTQSTLTAVAAVGDDIWAVGHDAVIVHSSDQGATWEIQNFEPELERPFLDVEFFDAQNGIAIGAYGLFYRTVDGGENWQAEQHAELLDPMDQEYLLEIREESEEFYLQELSSILPHLNRVSVNGEELLMAGESGLLAKSEDKGVTWQRLSVDYLGSFFDISAINAPSNEYVAVGLRGNAFYSADGESWQSIQTCTKATLNTLKQTGDSSMLAVGNNDVLVSMSLPLEDAINTSESQCGEMSSVKTTQTQDKSAVVSVDMVNGKVLAVTSEGLKTIAL
jgi:photosystem II stability/assembly factor-like uncharacterized protein